MEKTKLEAQKREIVGRKVKKLRKEEILPANIYGKKTKSLSVQVNLKEFDKVYREAGETGIVDITVKGEKESRPVLVQNLQKNPVNGNYLHVDFRQVVMSEKIVATVPIETMGEAPAETQKVGIMIQLLSEVEIEALPADLPEHIQVEVGKLANVGEVILVKDLVVDRGKISIKNDPNLIVVKIEPLAKEEVVTPPPAEVAAEGAAPAGDGVKPEGTVEETKTPEEKKEPKPAKEEPK